MAESMLLLDTNILSLMGRRKSPPGLRPWLLEVGIDRLGICYPVIAELLRGVHLRMHDNPARAAEIRFWVEQILATDFPRPDMTPEVASVYAEMTSLPRLKNMWVVQKNQRNGRLGHDLMIAAVAIAHRLPIVTANVADYVRINEHFALPGIYHPLEARWHVRPGIRVTLPRFNLAASDSADTVLPTISESQRLSGERAISTCSRRDTT
jgi:predicted nucleic acid-binding protein